MSVQTEITRLESAKQAIASAIADKGVSVPDGTMLDGMAALIESITAGSGGSTASWMVASGSITGGGTKTVTISGIPFNPKTVMLRCNVSSTSSSYGWMVFLASISEIDTDFFAYTTYSSGKTAIYFANTDNLRVTYGTNTVTISNMPYALKSSATCNWYVGGLEE